NYDCGFAKTFVMGQYFKGVQTSGVNALAMLDDLNVTKDVTYLDQADSDYDKGVKGYGLHLGTIVPIGNGDLTVGAYYVDGTGETSKATVEERDFDYMGLATKYEYRLSKRTSVYLAAAYSKTTVDATANHKEIEGQLTQVFTGLTHAF
ncbi:MAG: porin, partial [Sutterella wadsworthensis]